MKHNINGIYYKYFCFLNKYIIIVNKNKITIIRSFNTIVITFFIFYKKSGFIHFMLNLIKLIFVHFTFTI